MQNLEILTPTERRQKNRNEMTDIILQTALTIMHEDGVGALNLNELARRVHMRPSSLYVYFSGKMAIYDALYVLGIRNFYSALEPLFITHTNPWKALQDVFESALAFSVQNPEQFQICFERPIPGFEPTAASMAETDRLTNQIYLLLNQAMPASQPYSPGEIPPSHGLFVALWQGLTTLHIANDPGVPVGSGRFGSLIPAAIAIFKAGWSQASSTGTPQNGSASPGL
ncbi:MAG TPA: TetR/AcrR family transcriptional regulator [Bellilinea sp.]